MISFLSNSRSRQILGDSHPTKTSSDAGFTLYEMLVALAIISIISGAMFQGLSQYLIYSQKSMFASRAIFSDTFNRELFASVVKNSYIGYFEPEEHFLGRSSSISGVSYSLVGGYVGDVRSYSFSIEKKNNASSVLLRTESKIFEVYADLIGDVRFVYLSDENEWYESWPPKELKALNRNESPIEDISASSNLVMPMAVRLVADEKVVSAVSLIRRNQIPAIDLNGELIDVNE